MDLFALVSEYPTGRLVILEDPSRVIRSEWLLETKMLKFEDMDFRYPAGMSTYLNCGMVTIWRSPRKERVFAEGTDGRVV